MNSNELILMVTPSTANFETLGRTLINGGNQFEARRAHDIPTALARVAGGGVSAIVLDISGFPDHPNEDHPGADNEPGADHQPGQMDGLDELRAAAPALPVVLWSDSEVSPPPALAARLGASGSVTADANPSELKRILRDAILRGKPLETAGNQARGSAARAAVIAVMGVKGGVGTTTVALNVATALTARGSVILAEIRSTFGSLQGHFHPGRLVRGLTSLRGAPAVALESRVAASVLWPVPQVSGLRVLFGPHAIEDCCEMEPAEAAGILERLAGEADFVVVDLPVSLSPGNRAILGASQYLALVLELAPACLRLGKLTLDAIQAWDKTPSSAGAVVVKRSAENPSVPLRQIEIDLGVPILGVIPPAPELCALGERSHLPMIECDPDSIAAQSFVTLAESFHSQAATAGRAAPKFTLRKRRSG